VSHNSRPGPRAPPLGAYLLGNPLHQALAQPGAPHVLLSKLIGFFFPHIHLQPDRYRNRLLRPARKRHSHLSENKANPPERAVFLPCGPRSVAIRIGRLDLLPAFLANGLVYAQADRLSRGHLPGRLTDESSPQAVHLTEKGPAQKGVKPRVVPKQTCAGSPQIVRHRVPHRGQQKAHRQKQENRLRGLRETLGEAALKERPDSSLGKSVYHGGGSWVGEEDHFCSHPFTSRASPWFLFWPHGR